MPFEDRLKKSFPLPGWKGARRRDEQVRRFIDFLSGIVLDEHPNVVAAEEERECLEEESSRNTGSKQGRLCGRGRGSSLSQSKRSCVRGGEGQIRAEAERRLREMKRDGIPAHLFRVAILWADELYKERVSAMRSEASRARWSARTK